MFKKILSYFKLKFWDIPAPFDPLLDCEVCGKRIPGHLIGSYQCGDCAAKTMAKFFTDSYPGEDL